MEFSPFFHEPFTYWNRLFPKEFTGQVYNSIQHARADREMCSLWRMGTQIQGLPRQRPTHAVRFLLLHSYGHPSDRLAHRRETLAGGCLKPDGGWPTSREPDSLESGHDDGIGTNGRHAKTDNRPDTPTTRGAV